MYSYWPPHMAGQKQDDQLEHTFSSSVRIQDVALKTFQRRWTRGRSGERGSGISVLAARHDDDDDDDDYRPKKLSQLELKNISTASQQRGKITSNGYFGYVTKPFDGEASVQELHCHTSKSTLTRIVVPWWGNSSRRKKTLNSNLLNST